MAEALPFKTTMQFAYGEPRELAPGVVRIVANNPSPFTFKGTNTYIVGTRELALIDPGPDDAAHLAAILKTIGGRRLTHILITHTHRDHTDGLPALLAATGAKTAGFGRARRRPAAPSAPARRAASSSTRISCRTCRWPTARRCRATAGRSRRCTRRAMRRTICASRWREPASCSRATT